MTSRPNKRSAAIISGFDKYDCDINCSHQPNYSNMKDLNYPVQNTECHSKLQNVMSSHVDIMMSIYMYNTVFPRITNMVCALFWFVAVSHKKRLILPTFVMITSLALGQSYHWPSARKATLKNNGKCITQSHRSWWYNHNKGTWGTYYFLGLMIQTYVGDLGHH